jgi:dUTP pyrophosphatase
MIVPPHCLWYQSSTIISFNRLALSSFALFSSNSNSNYSIMPEVLQVKLLSENATMPSKGSPLSAGFDLASAESLVIPKGERRLVKTDLSIACPSGTYGRIAPRSGLAYKKGIDVGAGVVDADYRGPVGVILFNFGEEDFSIEKGDRIAQLILEKVCMTDAVEVSELDDTVRGEGGFGSTGVSSKKQRTITPVNSSEGAEMNKDE